MIIFGNLPKYLQDATKIVAAMLAAGLGMLRLTAMVSYLDDDSENAVGLIAEFVVAADGTDDEADATVDDDASKKRQHVLRKSPHENLAVVE